MLFRDDEGKPGLIGQFCPHRDVDLSYGRLEHGGLRCLYHGWLLARDGRCLEQPASRPGARSRTASTISAYPLPRSQRPDLRLPRARRSAADPDLPVPDAPSESSVGDEALERLQLPARQRRQRRPAAPLVLAPRSSIRASRCATAHPLRASTSAPQLMVEETPFGLRAYACATADDGESTTCAITNFVMPNGSAFDGVPIADPKSGRRRPTRATSLTGTSRSTTCTIGSTSSCRVTTPLDGPCVSRPHGQGRRSTTYARPRTAPTATCKTATR